MQIQKPPFLSLSLSLSSPMASHLRCCSSPGSSSHSSSLAAAATADRMVKIELEAAEALADLAHLAMREPEAAAESRGKWGSKGRRAMKRVKGESPPGFDSVDSAHKCSVDRSEDRPVVDQLRSEDLSRNTTVRPIKPEHKTRLQRPCSTSHSSFGSKSRQNLTEDEKEARRIRRILANRESARQTIRRRQALCEELAKKAADLARENENLKREKELALKEYKSLETTNKDLKARVAKAIKTEVEVVQETQCKATSGQGDASTSPPKNCPLLLYDRPPFAPLFWPAMVQSSNASQSHGPQIPPFLPPSIPVPAISKPEFSNKQESLVNINGPITPIYLVPCPWFFPLPDQANGLHSQPFFCVSNKQDENSVSNRSSACISAKDAANLALNGPSPAKKAKTDDSGSVEAMPVNDLNEAPVGHSQNGGGSTSIMKVHSKENFLSLAPASCSLVQPASAEQHADSDFTARVEANSSTTSQNVTSLPEQSQEQDMQPSQKSMEAFAAAEARRRRKELTRLKNLHGRHCRMHC